MAERLRLVSGREAVKKLRRAGWAPYLSLQDVRKLDAVREALRDGNLAAAMKAARVFRLTPVTG